MMRALSAALLAAAFIAVAAAPLPAAAKAYPKVGGMSCSAAARQVGAGNVWRTSFSGSRQVGEMITTFVHYSASPCFTSQASCKAWLYNTQTAWPQFMDFVPCHRGMR